MQGNKAEMTPERLQNLSKIVKYLETQKSTN